MINEGFRIHLNFKIKNGFLANEGKTVRRRGFLITSLP